MSRCPFRRPLALQSNDQLRRFVQIRYCNRSLHSSNMPPQECIAANHQRRESSRSCATEITLRITNKIGLLGNETMFDARTNDESGQGLPAAAAIFLPVLAVVNLPDVSTRQRNFQKKAA